MAALSSQRGARDWATNGDRGRRSVQKAFGEQACLIDGWTFQPAARRALSALSDPMVRARRRCSSMLTGLDEPDAGSAEKAARRWRLGLYRPDPGQRWSPDKTVWEDISGGQDVSDAGQARSRPAGPMSAPSASRVPTSRSSVGQLSGGERNRVHLAKMLKTGAPTCCCSMSRRMIWTSIRCVRLKKPCSTFAGCAVVISHDRWFLDRVATHILAFEGESHVEWFQGNYEAYDEDRKRRLGAAADQPHRIKFKPLTR